jgi:heavy metal sensor kinase
VVLGPQRLLSLMFVIAPFIIFASTLIGYFLVGRTLKPVENIVDEVEAISDGRSLHRRLVEPKTGDEIARLSATLNAMLTRLERSFISLRRFTADASHELKTPLTVLRSGVERAITHAATPPEVLEVLEESLIEVNRMTEMVDALLMLARADEGRAPLHLEQVDLREILAEVTETASILGEQAGVTVEVAVPPAPLVLAADPSRIRQLLMNLLTNATKYTPKGGNVWIESEVADGRVKLIVRDTGIGIAPGDLPHVFDRFWRADAARSRTGERPGAGLGLAICKWIAEAHGGSIEVQSRPGRGTTFTVTLQMSGEAPARAAEPAVSEVTAD